MFQKSLISRYKHRPLELRSMCLAEFNANFVTNYQHKDDDDDDSQNDVLSPTSTDDKTSQINNTN